MTTKPKFFAKKRNIVLTVVGALVAVWASVTVLWPLVIGDGLSGRNYNDAQKKAAQGFINMEKQFYSPASFTVRVHIDDIRPSTPEEKANCSLGRQNNDPDNALYYTVEYTVGRWGGLNFEHKILPACTTH